jgi:hypothetical protein
VHVLGFTVGGHDAGFLAAALSAEYGIGVRDGAFCAHLPVDRLIAALRTLVIQGPKWSCTEQDGRWVPDDDSRPLPPFLS